MYVLEVDVKVASMIDTTVKQGVEVMLKEAIPELAGVYDVTDHSEGESPFFTG